MVLRFDRAILHAEMTLGGEMLLQPKPINLAMAVTTRCNSRCKTCNIWETPPVDISLATIESLCKELGQSLIWVTLTGGEPFIRNDLNQVVETVIKYCRPKFLNIATNGILTGQIEALMPDIVHICQMNKTVLTINLSIDEIEENYSSLRCDDGFAKICASREYLRRFPVRVGVNIAISKYNASRFKTIYHFIEDKIAPDMIVAERATARKAFFLSNEDRLEPDDALYFSNLQFLRERKGGRGLVNKIVTHMRNRYYREMLNKNFRRQCYALKSSVEIMPNGDVISCCERGLVIGNLHDSSFEQIWHSKPAMQAREWIAQGCHCSAISPYYTSCYHFLRWAPRIWKKIIAML